MVSVKNPVRNSNKNVAIEIIRNDLIIGLLSSNKIRNFVKGGIFYRLSHLA
jgi:hypothetical protein